MKKSDKITVVGEKGLVTSALMRRLGKHGLNNVVLLTPLESGLTDQHVVHKLFYEEKPEYVFLTSAMSGGIAANNSYPADFIYQNLQAQTNVIDAAYRHGVQRMLYLGSSCMYPKDCPQPMKEEYLFSGKLEPTSESYATAKIAGMIMCQSYNRQYGTNFIRAIPADLYGPEDDFESEDSHVMPALLRKIHTAKKEKRSAVTIWGTGLPRREFLHADDLADACIFLIDNYFRTEEINIGFGEDTTIKDLAMVIKRVVGFEGELVYDSAKPDGAPRKLLDSSRIKDMGWAPQIGLEEGIRQTYQWYLDHHQEKSAGFRS